MGKNKKTAKAIKKYGEYIPPRFNETEPDKITRSERRCIRLGDFADKYPIGYTKFGDGLSFTAAQPRIVARLAPSDHFSEFLWLVFTDEDGNYVTNTRIPIYVFDINDVEISMRMGCYSQSITFTGKPVRFTLNNIAVINGDIDNEDFSGETMLDTIFAGNIEFLEPIDIINAKVIVYIVDNRHRTMCDIHFTLVDGVSIDKADGVQKPNKVTISGCRPIYNVSDYDSISEVFDDYVANKSRYEEVDKSTLKRFYPGAPEKGKSHKL